MLDGIGKSTKRRIKRRLIKLLSSIVIFLFVIIVIVGSIIGIAEAVKDKFTSFFKDNTITYNDTRDGMEKMLSNMSKEEIEKLPIDKDVLDTILAAEKQCIRNNETISVEWKEREKKRYKVETNRGIVQYRYYWDTSYHTMDVNLKYYDYTYQYRLYWQLLFALSVIKDLDAEEVKDIADKLQPKFKYKKELKKYYSYDDVRKLKYLKTDIDDKGDCRYYKYYPLVVMDSVETFLNKYIYKYKKINTTSGYSYEIDSIEIEDNSRVFFDILDDLRLSVSDIELLVEVIRSLPDGEYVAYQLKDVMDKASFTGLLFDKKFNADIPLIEGQWTREDLAMTAMSLQGLDYYWGGKYTNYGSNPRWGKLTKVFASGSWSTGKCLPLGLDCSGFVEWVYYQMLGKSISNYGGTYSMWSNSYAIDRNELKIGDVGFYQRGGGKHIGIYIGKIDGVDAFIHAGGRTWKDDIHPAGQVIVTKQYERYNGYPPSKFKYFRRFPIKFKDDE